MAAVDSDASIFPLPSGRYQYRWWHFGDDGQRRADKRPPVGRESSLPDLVNTAYRNGDGSRTVYGLVFDLDAHRADRRWLDDDGRLDWQRISSHLSADHADLFRRISHVVRSTGGKGLGLVLAINPLPIQKSTETNQRAASNLQRRLIGFFHALGLGADPGASGLERDLPNHRDPSRRLYENHLAMRRAEQGKEAVLTQLHAYLNRLAAKERQDGRIYNDARAEPGLARLVAWLLGVYDPAIPGTTTPLYLSGEAVWASTKTLQQITGLSDKFLRCFLKAPPAWLVVDYVLGEGWRLNMPLGRAVQRLLPRAEALLAQVSPTARVPRLLFSVATLPRPSEVQHGERNRWLTALALSYKWHGYAMDESLAKILARMQAVLGYEESRNCRQVRSIVRAIFKNVPETAGRFADRELPAWMTSENEFKIFTKGTSTRRGEAPGVQTSALGLGQESAATGPKLASFEPVPLSIVSDVSKYTEVLCLSSELESQGAVALTAIRWRQRVGIFDGERLVLCVTRHHYRASAALTLLGASPQYKGRKLHIYTPHKDRQACYHAAIDACEAVGKSGIIGYRRYAREKWAAWVRAKGMGDGPGVYQGDALAPPF